MQYTPIRLAADIGNVASETDFSPSDCDNSDNSSIACRKGKPRGMKAILPFSNLYFQLLKTYERFNIYRPMPQAIWVRTSAFWNKKLCRRNSMCWFECIFLERYLYWVCGKGEDRASVGCLCSTPDLWNSGMREVNWKEAMVFS